MNSGKGQKGDREKEPISKEELEATPPSSSPAEEKGSEWQPRWTGETSDEDLSGLSENLQGPEVTPEDAAEAELHDEFDKKEAREAVEAVVESARDDDPDAERRGEVVVNLLDQGERSGEAPAAIPEDLVNEANKGSVWGKRIIDFLTGMKRGAPTFLAGMKRGAPGFFAGMGMGAAVRMGVRGALGSVGLLNAAGGLGVGVLAGGLAGAGRGWYREWRAYQSFVSKDLGLEKGKIVEKMPAEVIAEKMKELEGALEQAREAKQRREAEAISDKLRYLRIAAMKGERGMKPYERAMEILDQRKEELASDQDRHAKLLRDLSRGSRSLLWSRRVAKSAIIGAAGGAVGAFLVDWIATGSFSEGLKEWMPGGGGDGGDGGGGGIPPEGPSGAETAPAVTVGEPTEPAPATVGEPTEPAPATVGEPTEPAPATVSEPTEPVPAGLEGAMEMIPLEDISLEEGLNPWEVVKAKLSEILPDGRTPTDAEIMYVTRELAEKSNINVPSWGVSGDVPHTEIPVGYELNFSDSEVQEAFRDVLKGEMKPFVPVETPSIALAETPSVPEASAGVETVPQGAAESAAEDAVENASGSAGNFENVDTDSILRMTRAGNLEDAAQKLSEQSGLSYEDALKNVQKNVASMDLPTEGIEQVKDQAYDDALDMVRQGNAGEGAKILSDSWGMSEDNARSVLEKAWEILPEVDKMKPEELIAFLKGSFPELGGVNVENAAVRSLLEKTTVENAMAGRFSWDEAGSFSWDRAGESVSKATRTAIRTLLEKAKAGTYSAFFDMNKGLDKMSVWEFLRDQVGRAGKQ